MPEATRPSRASPAQSTALFTTLIIRTYSSKFTPGELPEVAYQSATSPAPGKVEVSTNTLYQGSRYEVVYRLVDLPGKGWRVTDVVIEGVSMVTNYRGQFTNELKQTDMAGLIQRISDKNKSNDATDVKNS